MNLDPFLEASFAIQLHMAFAVFAFFLGCAILWRRKGGNIHKLLGRIWVAAMLVVSFSSFFIHELKVIGDYSPIHILSVTTPIGLVYAIWAIRNGNVRAHLETMRATFLGGMIIAGGFTFLPGRISYRMFFGESNIDTLEFPGAWIIPLMFAAAIALYYSSRAKQS